jgi:CRISPR-associated endonuclease/helicase Cas3
MTPSHKRRLRPQVSCRLRSDFIRGLVPASMDIPTGLGKTKVMAIWLIALSSGAALPRRLLYVVDRRAVVDQASGEAAEIADRYGKTVGGEIAISTLRGQHVDSGVWREDPSRLAIVVGTVDMIGSRLLFEGCGVSRRMRPLHAGLLGVDSLVVLDEAHLVPPFRSLMETISADPALAGRARLLVPRLQLMSLVGDPTPRGAGSVPARRGRPQAPGGRKPSRRGEAVGRR